MKKNIIIIILSILVLGLGGYLVYGIAVDNDDNSGKIQDNVDAIDTEEKEESVDNSKTEQNGIITNSMSVSKYAGTYKGEKGTDSIIINEDGTYEFVRAYTDVTGHTETTNSKGLVISNGVYIALVEFYDSYPKETAPLLNSYHFYIDGSSLNLFEQVGTTDSINFTKSN